MSNYICTVDIGSSKISAAAARIRKDSIAELFVESMPAEGIRMGGIVDSIDAIDSVTRVLKNLRSASGINIKSVYVNVCGQDIVTKESHAVIPLAERGNKLITQSDLERVNEQARILGSSLDEEIIHQIPRFYRIDTSGEILNPLGLYSHRLEVELYLICIRDSCLQSITRTINQAGFDIKKIFLSGLAAARVVFNQQQTKGIHLLCDIGSDISELMVLKDGTLASIDILKLGGDSLTAKLQEEFKITRQLAEDVKRSHGAITDSGQIEEDKEILIKREEAYRPIKQRLVAEVISAKTRAICQELKESTEKRLELSRIDSFTVIGRSVLLEGFLETLENTLGIPVKLGRIVDQELLPFTNRIGALSGHKYLTYLNCLGLIRLAREGRSFAAALPSPAVEQNILDKAVGKFKEFYEEYF